MTRNVALSVQRDVSSQMEAIRRLADLIEGIMAEAKEDGDTELFAKAERMAMQLADISRTAYSVGTTVLDNAA